MNANDILGTVSTVLRTVCQRPDLHVVPSCRLIDIEELDSLRLMETVALVEDHLGVEVDTGGLEGLVTIADIVALISRAHRLGGRAEDEPSTKVAAS